MEKSNALKLENESFACYQGDSYILAELPDSQQVFIRESDRNKADTLVNPCLKKTIANSSELSVYPVTSENLKQFTTTMHPRKGPKALGAIPRLGIGVRHSTYIWPGIWRAMNRGDFSANAIQNSVRELHLLETLQKGEPPRVNHLFSFGPLQEGHTGSTFERHWTSGVLSALKSK